MSTKHTFSSGPSDRSGGRFEVLKSAPELDKVTRRIMRGMLPVIGTTHVANSDPSSRVEVRDVKVDLNQLSDYVRATGLRLSNEVPPTFFFVVSFPICMELMSRKDYPFSPTGAVHIANEITQKRALRVDESYTIQVHGENLRPHRKGLLVDMITDVFAEGDTTGEPIWSQASTFLGQGQKFAKSAPVSLTTRGEDNARHLEAFAVPEFASNSQFAVTRAEVANYVVASGDKNPIHTSKAGAKLFGFPGIIAHGMYTAATVLRLLEGKLSGALRYRVEFYKPIIIPTRVAEWAITGDDQSVDIQLRSASKPEKLHLNARVDYL